jgi:Uma2 family endonuclease
MALPRERWTSLEQYLELEHTSLDIKYEYVDGRIYAMSGGSTSHSLIAMNIYALLRPHLRGSPCRVYNSDMKFCLSETVRYYPDVTVSCDPRDTQVVKHDLAYPRLIIEVLSPSTELRDRTEKLARYQRCPTLQEYVLVSQDRQVVEVYVRDGKKWIYQRFESGEEMELASIDFRCPIAAFYEDVSFAPESQ